MLTDMQIGKGTNFWIDDLRFYADVFTPGEQCQELMGGTWDGNVCN